MAKKPITQQFSSGEYTFETFDDVHGLCIQPDRIARPQPDEFIIFYHGSMKGKTMLETLIHESLHAEFPKMTENEVSAAGKHLAEILWKFGYRRKDR